MEVEREWTRDGAQALEEDEENEEEKPKDQATDRGAEGEGNSVVDSSPSVVISSSVVTMLIAGVR